MGRLSASLAITVALLPAPALTDVSSASRDDVMMSIVGAQDADEQTFVEEIRLPAQTPRKGQANAGVESNGRAPTSAGSPTADARSAEAREAARQARELGRRQAAEARQAAREAREQARRTSPGGASDGRGGGPPGAGHPGQEKGKGKGKAPP